MPFSLQMKTPGSSSGMERHGGMSYSGAARRRLSGVSYSAPQPSLDYADSHDDSDESSCDATFASTISSRRSSRRKSQRFDDRILRETSHVTNKLRSRSRSSLKRTSKKLDYEGDVRSSSTVGVLDILEDDINSLKLLQTQTTEISEDELSTDQNSQRYERGSSSRRSGLSMRGGTSNFSSPHNPGTKSVDLSFPDFDPDESMKSGISRQSRSRNKKKACHVKNDELLKIKVLTRENELLQASLRKVKEDSAKIIDQVKDDSVKIAEHNEMKLNEVSDIKLQLKMTKSKEAQLERALRDQLDISKSKEEEFEQKLRDVTNNARRNQEIVLVELSDSRAENGELLKKIRILEQENERQEAMFDELSASQAKNDELMKKFRVLEQENDQLQEMARNAKYDSEMIMDDNTEILSELSSVKSHLDQSILKEAKLRQVLREVITNVESEQGNMSDELLSFQEENEELLKRFKALEQENEQLHDTVCTVEDQSVKFVEHKKVQLNESKTKEVALEQALRDVVGVIKNLRQENEQLHETVCTVEDKSVEITERNKLQLYESKNKEAELEQTLREVLSNVESKQESLLEELSTAYKLHQLEVTLLGERLKGASKEIVEREEAKSVESATSRAENDVLRKENEQLLEAVRSFQEDSAKITEHGESELLNVKSELEKSKSKEVELDHALRDVVSKVEILSKELVTAYEKHRSEATLWEERHMGVSREIVEKTNMINKLESEIEKLQRSFTEYKEQAEEHTSEKNDCLEKELKSTDNLLEKVRSLEVELESSRSGYSELEERTRQINDKLSHAEMLNKKTGNTMAENDTLNKTLAEVTEEKRNFTTMLSDLKTSNESLKEANNRLEQSLGDATEEHRKIANHVRNLKADNDSLVQTIGKAKEASSILQKSLVDAKEENSNVSEKLSCVETELDSQKKSLIEKDLAMAGMKLQLSALEKKIGEKEKSSSRLELRLVEAKKLMGEMELKLINLRTKSDSDASEKEEHIIVLEKNISDLEEEKQAQAAQIERATESKTKYAEMQTTLESSEQATEKIHVDMQAKLADAEKKNESLKAKILVKERQLVSMNKATDVMCKTVDDLKANIRESQTQISSLQSELISVNERLWTFKIRNAKLQEEIAEQASNAQVKESRLSGLKSDLVQAKKDNELIHGKIDDMRLMSMSQSSTIMTDGEISSLKSELVQVKERLQTSKKRNMKLQKEIEKQPSCEQVTRLEDKNKELMSDLILANSSLTKSDANLKKVRKESSSRNGELKSALQSLDEMRRYNEDMQEENDKVVALLEGELEEANKQIRDTRKEMKMK